MPEPKQGATPAEEYREIHHNKDNIYVEIGDTAKCIAPEPINLIFASQMTIKPVGEDSQMTRQPYRVDNVMAKALLVVGSHFPSIRHRI